MRMLLQAGYDTFTGYGNDGVDMAIAFEKLGVDVVPWPTSLLPPLPKQFTDLLHKEPMAHPIDIALRFGPPADVKPHEFASLGDVAVGWTMWERTPLLRSDMIGNGWKDEETREYWWGRHPGSLDGRNKDWLDLMVLTAPVGVRALEALDPLVPTAVVPNGIDVARFPEMERRTDRPMRFASIGMLAGRKNVFATLRAWELAQKMDPTFDAELILKTSTTGLHPKLSERYKNVTIIASTWTQQQVLDFYGDVDVLVSTSRGEGNNKPAMEFMATGGPVMATNWSGHENWLHPDTGYPLPGYLEEPIEGCGYMDFSVDEELTAKTFLHCWKDQAAVRRKGALSAQTIRSSFTWEKVCDRFMRRVLAVM